MKTTYVYEPLPPGPPVDTDLTRAAFIREMLIGETILDPSQTSSRLGGNWYTLARKFDRKISITGTPKGLVITMIK